MEGRPRTENIIDVNIQSQLVCWEIKLAVKKTMAGKYSGRLLFFWVAKFSESMLA